MGDVVKRKDFRLPAYSAAIALLTFLPFWAARFYKPPVPQRNRRIEPQFQNRRGRLARLARLFEVRSAKWKSRSPYAIGSLATFWVIQRMAAF